MPFNELEVSRRKGSPVTLYYFRYGDDPGAYHGYTDAEQEIIADGNVGGPAAKRSIYIAVDRSGSMEDDGKLQAFKDAMSLVIDELITQVANGLLIDMAINFWSNNDSVLRRFNCDEADLESIRTFVNNATASGGTNFVSAVTDAIDWFETSLDSPSVRRRVFLFITDGNPEPISSAQQAANLASDMFDKASGQFNVFDGTAVDMYGVNIQLQDTTYTAMLDNTAEDGVPVVSTITPEALVAVIKNAVYPETVYTPVPIMRGSISTQGNLDRSALEIKLPATTALAELYRFYPPSRVVNVVIRQGHLTDPDLDFPAVWVGRVISSSRDGNEQKFTCEPISTSMRRTGLRRNYQYGCPHALYGPQCRASKEAASVFATVVEAANNLITLPVDWNNAPPSKYTGGLVEWTTPQGNREIRTILQVPSGVGLLVNGNLRGIEAGTQVLVSLGCNHQMTDCQDLHIENGTGQPNIKNYGGQPWIPTQNPLGTRNNFY